MKKIKTLLIWVGSVVFATTVSAQLRQPLVPGDRMTADDFSRIQSPGKKLYILDFWSTGCSSCVQAFPKMEHLRDTFSKDLQVILIDSYESQEAVHKWMTAVNRNRTANHEVPFKMPELPGIMGDTLFKQLFPHVLVPHHVWIDGQGKVLAVTSGHNATAEHVRKALDGQLGKLAVKQDLRNDGYDTWKEGIFKSGHRQIHPAFYSGFVHSAEGMGSGNANLTDSAEGTYRRTWINSDVLRLYFSASYAMPTRPRLSVELKDAVKFHAPEDANLYDAWFSKYGFSYEQFLPLASQPEMGAIMLADLNRYFGPLFGIDATIEKRNLPALVIVLQNRQRIATSKKTMSIAQTGTVYEYINASLKSIGLSIRGQLEDLNKPLIVVNEIPGADSIFADMKLNLNAAGLPALRKQLQSYGLDLITSQRTVDVLVVRDKTDRRRASDNQVVF